MKTWTRMRTPTANAVRRTGLAVITMLATAPPVIAQSADGVEVPLRVEGGRLVVTVLTPDGHPADFGISTANGLTVLAETAAEHLGTSPSLLLGSLPVNTESVHTVPDADLAYDGLQLAGLIGANTLADYDVLVDVPGGRLVLKPIGPAVSWAGVRLGPPERVRVLHGIVFSMDVELAGTTFGATLDLGTTETLINAPVSTALGLADGDTAALRIGSSSLGDVPVRISDHALFQRWDPTGRGFAVVGSAIARECAVALSWVHQEIRSCVR